MLMKLVMDMIKERMAFTYFYVRSKKFRQIGRFSARHECFSNCL